MRYISNHSSGKQGFALAEAALDAGAAVTLVSGPVDIQTPAGAERIDVITAREMHDSVMAQVDGCDIFIGVAAVADFRPESACAEKIKKHGNNAQSLDMVPNPDIIASVAARPSKPLPASAVGWPSPAQPRSSRGTTNLTVASTFGTSSKFARFLTLRRRVRWPAYRSRLD